MQEKPPSKSDRTNPEALWIRHPDFKGVVQKSLLVTIALGLLMIPSGLCSQQQLIRFAPAPGFRQADADQLKPSHLHKASVSSPIPVKSSPENKVAVEAAQPPFHDVILQAAKTYQVDPALIKAIIMAESNYNPQAVSQRGAQGLMQLMPSTAKWLGVADSFDPAHNINGGVRYFRYLLDRFKGDVQLALAAYNAGILHVLKYDGIPPFDTTQSYVKKVLEYHQRYQREMAAYGLNSSAV